MPAGHGLTATTSCHRRNTHFANVQIRSLRSCFPELANNPWPDRRAFLYVVIKVNVHPFSPPYLVDDSPVFYPPCMSPPHAQSQFSNYRNKARSIFFFQKCDSCRWGRDCVQPDFFVWLDAIRGGIVHATSLHCFRGIRRMGKHDPFVCTAI